MEPQAWFTLAVVLALIVVLAREMVAPAVAVLAATIVLLLTGIIDSDAAFAGFSNEAPIIVAALLVFARAADVAGIVGPALERFFGPPGGDQRWALPRLVFPIAGLSAFLNNTTLVAMTVPAVLDLCRRRGLSPSRFLIPISFAAVLGGVMTTVGTSTNLTVSGLLRQSGMEPFSLFEFSAVGVPLALAGCLVVVLLAGRLLPDRDAAGQQGQGDAARDFTVSMSVKPGGPIDGKTVEEAGLRHLHGVFLVEISRGERLIGPVAPTEVLRGGDVLTFVGRVDDVVDLHRMRGLQSAAARQIDHLAGGGQAFYEAVVGPELVNVTLQEIGFRARYGAAVLAIHRAGQRIEAKLGEVRLHLGDTLLVLADAGFRSRFREGRDFLLTAPLRGLPPTRGARAIPVGLIGIGFVVATGTGLLPILHAALLTAVLVIASGALTVRQARDAVDLNIVVLIAAAFGLGAAVQHSGLGAVIADLIVDAMMPFGALGALAAVLVATMLLTEMISNNAAAVLAFPVAVATAAATGSDPRPFVIAVTMGASLSFLTPIGYQTNLMVYGLGGYRFGDFSRLGAPVNVVVVMLALVLIPLVFPF
ncbi:MAG TPA: SLC13 family permease [Candidatus Limnocylindria bacterium]